MLHSGSIFHNANNFAVLGGTFYAANSLVVKQVQGENSPMLTLFKALIYVLDYDRTLRGIVEGADVVCFDNGNPFKEILSNNWPTVSQFTPGDVVPKNEIHKGRGYRVYSAHSTAKARAVTIKLYEGSRAKDVGMSSWHPDQADLLICRFKRCLAAASFSRKVMYETLIPCFITLPHYEPGTRM